MAKLKDRGLVAQAAARDVFVDALRIRQRELEESLAELANWMRTYTRPTDGTNEMLLRAVSLLPPELLDYEGAICLPKPVPPA